jgi:glycosyltransferase involved in cell wall biosynthesis
MRQVDILVGIPSYNNEKTIGFVVEQVDRGLQRYFPKKRAIIVGSDGKSSDGTRKSFEETETKTEKLFVQYRNPVPGKGSAFKEIWEIGLGRGAKYFAVFDSDLRSITPEWVKQMVLPLLNGADYCTPYYSRHKYDGTITNQICFPITFGLFCHNIRQPIGGDFSFSARLAEFWLKRADWKSDTARFGIDIFMTSQAVLNGFKARQVFLGTKVHDPKDPAASLKPMFEQVVGTLFKMVLQNKEKWINLRGVEQVPVLSVGKFVEPQQLQVNEKKMMEDFSRGKEEKRDAWAEILSESAFNEIDSMEKPRIGSGLWSTIVLDSIASFSKKEGKVVDALIPLWLGRNYSFVQETGEANNEEAERLIIGQAKLFFKNRGYLIKKIR